MSVIKDLRLALFAGILMLSGCATPDSGQGSGTASREANTDSSSTVALSQRQKKYTDRYGFSLASEKFTCAELVEMRLNHNKVYPPKEGLLNHYLRGLRITISGACPEMTKLVATVFHETDLQSKATLTGSNNSAHVVWEVSIDKTTGVFHRSIDSSSQPIFSDRKWQELKPYEAKVAKRYFGSVEVLLFVEEAIGVRFDLKHTQSGVKNRDPGLWIASVQPEGPASRSGVLESQFLKRINGIEQTRKDPTFFPNGQMRPFEKAAIDALCASEVPNLALRLGTSSKNYTGQIGMVYRNKSITLPRAVTTHAICNAAPQVNNYRGLYSYYTKFEKGVDVFYVKPLNGQALSLIKIMHSEPFTNHQGTIKIHLLENNDTIVDTVTRRHYRAFFFRESGDTFAAYKYSGLLQNLSVNDYEMYNAGSRYSTYDINNGLARTYLWFAESYGRYCKSEIQELEKVKILMTKSQVDNFGNKNEITKLKKSIEVDSATGAATYFAIYNRIYELGIRERVDKMSDVVLHYGCTSSQVQNIRSNLYRYGNAIPEKLGSEKYIFK